MVYENQLSPYHDPLMSPNSPVQHFVDQHGNPIQKFTNQQNQQMVQQGYVMKGQHRYVPYSSEQRMMVNNNRMMSPGPQTYTIHNNPNGSVTYQQQNFYPSRTPPAVMFSPGGVSERSCSVPLSSPYMMHDNPQSPMFNMENIGTVRTTMPLRPNSQMSVSSSASPHHVPSSFSSEHSYMQQGNDLHGQQGVYSSQQPQQQQQQYQQQFHSENDIKLMIIRKIAEQLEASARTFDPNPIIVPKIIIRSASLDSTDSMPDLEPIPEAYSLTDIMEVIERDIQETRQMFPQRSLPSVIHHLPNNNNNNLPGHSSQVVKIIKQTQPPEKLIDFETIPVKTGRKTQTTHKRFQCIVCKKQFAGGSHLRNHFKTAVHRNEVLNTNQPDPVDLPETWRIEDFICTICAQTFNKRESLLKHMALHNKDGVTISQS